MKKKEIVKGYKMFNHDWTCQGFKYEVGETYKTDEKIELCKKGFHFCKKLEDCFRYYACVTWNHIAEVEALGEVIESDEDSKCVTNKIKIVREIDFAALKNTYGSNGVNESNGVNRSNGVNWSNGVNNSNGVNWSNGVNESNGVYNSFGVYRSSGVANALFCADKEPEYVLFNKKVSKERFDEVRKKLHIFLNNWRPSFNNMYELYDESGQKWSKTPIPLAMEKSKKDAWADMPKEAINYLKSLPEFDADIFKKVTGIEV